MGAWGALCIFDHDRFVGEVVPALRAGEAHPLVAEEIARARREPRRPLGELRGLADVMATFDEALAESTLGWAFRATAGRAWGYQELCALFERLVTRHCITHVENIGRVYRVIWSLSRSFGVRGVDDATEELIVLLDRRGRYWTHGSGGFSEGIHGWLDADEAALLALGLRDVRPDPESPEPDPDLVRIRRIARVVDQAVAMGRGLLWGADLAILYRPS